MGRAVNWPRVPALDSPDALDGPLPESWRLDKIENLYELLPIGKRFDQKSSSPQGRVPVIDQSEAGVIGWHNEEPGVKASESRPVVTFANHTCEMRWMQQSFSVIQNVFPLIGRSGVCDTRFLYYGTKGRVHLEEYKGHFPDYRRKWIPVPPIPEQRAIAHILGTLDDKIELNRRMSETLEATARALFKSWFVDFDPVRAKMEGRDPGLPQALADLFPARLVDSELGEIPEGWEVKSLDQIARFLNGLALQKYPPVGDRWLPVIKIAQLRAGNTAGADRASADLDADYVVKDGDILFSWSGSLDCALWAGGEGALNQHLFKVTSATYPRWLCYLGVHTHLDDFRHIAAGKATTMGHIQRHHLSDAKLVVPPAQLLVAMSEQLEPMIESLWKRQVESRTLAALRDTLLPKLISGELRVTNVGCRSEAPA